MKLIALTLVGAFAISGAAIGREKIRNVAPSARPATTREHHPQLGWDDRASSQKIYNWPDQRYYGQHGMMLD